MSLTQVPLSMMSSTSLPVLEEYRRRLRAWISRIGYPASPPGAGGRAMTEDPEIFHRIGQMVDEEHALYRRAEENHGLTDSEEAQLRGLEVALDQCWDLLQQRRAHREFGQNPDEAKLRDASTVEHYDPAWKLDTHAEEPRNPA